METRKDLVDKVAEYAEGIMSGNISYVQELGMLPDLIIFLSENLPNEKHPE